MISLCAILGTEFTLLQEDLLRLNPVTNKKRRDPGSNGNESQNVLREFIKKHQKLIELVHTFFILYTFSIMNTVSRDFK